MAKRILVADDDREIVRLVRSYLEKAGFTVSVAYDGQEALFIARESKPDLVILDLMMPKIDGLDVHRALRRESDVPVIMLTARIEEADKLVGLELGADDYVTKPFSPRELVARVRAVLRRAEGKPVRPERLSSGGIVLDLARHTVTIDGQPVDLTPTEFGLLTALMENPGRALTRLQLLELVQGQAYEGYERTVDAHIKNLRRKIEPHPKEPRYILTIYGVGYKFAEGLNAS